MAETVTVAGKKIKQLEMAEELHETDELVIEDESPKTNRTTLQKLYTWIVKQVMLAVYPVGTIYLSVESTNPGNRFGGTWVAWGAGRVPVGVDASQAEFNAVEKTGGNKSVNLSHQHTESLGWDENSIYLNYVDSNTTSGSGSVVVDVNSRRMTAPSEQTHPGRFNLTSSSLDSTSLLQPYITCYMWKRTE